MDEGWQPITLATVERSHILRTISEVSGNRTLAAQLLGIGRNTLLRKDSPSGPTSHEYRELQKRFVGTFQQLTAPVTAKGVEDTAYYVYNRLVSLNEVGGEPGHWGWSPERVHNFFLERAANYPGGLSPLSTHDTKRSEDVRARINVLTEIPGEWSDRVNRWMHLNRQHKVELEDGVTSPSANEEYLIYQTLVGIWPVGEPGARSESFLARVRAYVTKALREAKVHSSWINPDQEYENAATAFVEAILHPETSPTFLADLQQFVERIAHHGWLNGLSQTAIRCLAPGIPDTYQGTEAWDFSLVDPDNRRPVDYDALIAMLHDLEAAGLPSWENLADPRVKAFTVSRALRYRRDHAALFATGEYLPLTTAGEFENHLFGFLRTSESAAALILVPRLTVGLLLGLNRLPTGCEVWRETRVQLPEKCRNGMWTNLLTGESAEFSKPHLLVAELLGSCPVAIWMR